MISKTAPADLITGNETRVKMDEPVGLPASGMRQDQEKLLMKLVTEYILRMPEDVADERMNQIERKGKNISISPGQE